MEEKNKVSRKTTVVYTLSPLAVQGITAITDLLGGQAFPYALGSPSSV